MRSSGIDLRRAVLAAVLIASGVFAGWCYAGASGVLVIVLGTLAPLLILGGARTVAGGARLRDILGSGMLAVASLGATLLAMELALARLASSHYESAATPGRQGDGLVIRDEWKERPAQVPDAAHANYWHGKLHVYNEEGFRTVGDYEREDEKRRVVVLGDSLTFGVGIAAEDTYAAVLESFWKEADPTIRIYNLGVSGNQSQDIVRVAAKWLPILRPERVIYGICLNDFLPAGVPQYENNMAWQIPLPESVEAPLAEHTRVGAMTTELYNRALLELGIRDDFYADILRDFHSYQTRFRHDLIELNELARRETGKPVVALVLDQFPSNERGRRIAAIAEAAAAEAGMDVVPTDTYYRRFGDGKTQLHVSKWEGDPNEVANRIYAEMLAQALGLQVMATAVVTPVPQTE